ncbi:MAG TPA: tetratricopeptide repeat protein [Bacteroidota bacterium]|nr:tetratricopeptide repeat protein [Bacteroidota bacterium]
MDSWISNLARVGARHVVGLMVLIAFVGLVGCGGSSETAKTEGAPTDTTAIHPDTTMMAKHDTTAITPAAPETTAVVQAPPSREEMLQQQIEDIKTENVQLQQKLDASEQKNKDLMAKVSDLEAAQIAAQEKATKPTTAATAASRPAMTKVTRGASSSDMIQHYEGSVALARERKYKEAIDEFQSLLDAGIKSDYADNCHYWIGLCDYGLREYKSAIGQFQEVLKFKISEKKDDAQFMIAQAYERLGDRQQAQAEYRKFVELYPNSEYLKRAQAKLR